MPKQQNTTTLPRRTMLCQRSLAILFIVNVPIETLHEAMLKLNKLKEELSVLTADTDESCSEVEKRAVDMIRRNKLIAEADLLLTKSSMKPSTVTCLEPDFKNPMDNVTVSKGRDATFTCVVNNLGGYRVSPSSSASGDQVGAGGLRVAWIKVETKAILAIHETVITDNVRLSVSHNDINTWTLNIKDAQPVDRGTYMCQVNTNPMKSQSAQLEVVIPPDIMYEETSSDVMIPEGGSAKLVCKARGYPKPDIVWRREDGGDIIVRTESGSKTKASQAQGETLSFPNVGRNEMGAYLCIASNGVPPTVSKRMMLQVHFRPLIEVPNQLVGAPMRTDVTLSCKVEASPKPINYWTRESGEMIISNDKYAMSEETSNIYSSWMQLIIRDLHPRDFGGYKCISKNSLGDAESGIRLYEIALQEQKNEGGTRDNDYEEEEREQSNRLNHVYQGSLRESGSTLQPRGNAAAAASAGSSSRRNSGRPVLFLTVVFLLPVFLLDWPTA